jgi:hypothetical protein
VGLLDKILRRKSPPNTQEEERLRSCQCTQAQLQSETFQAWGARMHELPMHMHRKVWEYCYIAQALYERGMLTQGRRGLGFAVGQEPLPALFASLGCEIVATDLAAEEARTSVWVETGQHADSLESLNSRGICPPELFCERVSFCFLDMRHLPDDLGTYDFVWSACSLEHLGNMSLGEQFVYQSLKYLKPGGVCVHTTEFNVRSNFRTPTTGETVIFRKRDLQKIAGNIRRRGYMIDLDFAQGNLPYDHVVEKPPYKHQVHLKLLLEDCVVTSFGLIIESPIR